jgi:hypothetical protein
MKKTTLVSSETHLHPLRRSARKLRSCLAISTLLLTAAALLGPGGGGQRCAAQPNFPVNHLGNTTPADYQWDEQTFSIGVAQIQVEPNFTNLFAPTTSSYYYPGFSPSSGILTSPVMYDFTTWVGSSQKYIWDLTGPPTDLPYAYPAIVGVSGGPLGAFWQSVSGSDFYSMPTDFATPVNGYQMILTEIEMFDLTCDTGFFSCGSDARVPSVPTSLDMVTAGPNSGSAVTGTGGLGTDLSRRSIGMVQQQSTTPGIVAKSFFNIYVQVNIPAVTGNSSIPAFPLGVSAYTFGLARLTNAFSDPLVITNLNVTNLPPAVVYIHGETTAVPLYFMDNNLPYWSAGDLFGSLTLAGHGVFGCTNQPDSHDTNCCNQITAEGRVASLLDQTLGPVGSPRPPMPVAWQRTTNSFPTPQASYKSIVNTIVDTTTGQTNVLDATVSFPGTSFAIRDLSLGVFSNSIAPPAAHGTATFTATNVPISFQLASSGIWFPASGTGAVTMVISNTGNWSQTLTNMSGNPPPVTNYIVTVTGLTSRSTWIGGPVFLRIDPSSNNPSVGQHTIRQTAGGYRISSFFDVWLQESTDQVDWHSATNSLRLLPSLPPRTRSISPASITFTLNGNNLVLYWTGSFVLQNATSVTGPWTDLNGGVPLAGPYTNVISGSARYFRLRN